MNDVLLENKELKSTDLEKIELESIEVEKIELESIEVEKIEFEGIEIEKIKLESIEVEKIELERIEAENKGLAVYLNGSFLPGKQIGRNKTGGLIDIQINKLDGIIPVPLETTLIPPSIEAHYFKNMDERINVKGCVFVDTQYDLNTYDFVFYCNFCYNSNGEYQLSLYTTFDKQPPKESIPFTEYNNVFIFDITFNKGAITCNNGIPIPLDDIKTIEAFTINVDPRTSRGTVTSVQSSTD